jgi:hypothetical protein
MTQPDLFGAPTDTPAISQNCDNPVTTERRRLTANALRVLALLKARGPQGATNVELCQPDTGGLRGVGRVHDLRQDGWNVTKQHEGGGVWRYRLVSNPPRL